MGTENQTKKKSRKRKAKTSKYPKRSLELPKDTILRKQPITRPVLPPKHSAGPKIVYISSRTPFISAVKRVRKHFSIFEKQARASDLSRSHNDRYSKYGKGRQPYHSATINYKKPAPAAAAPTATSSLPPPSTSKEARKGKRNFNDEKKVVILRATGRAIEKLLGLGLYLQNQDDLEVQLRTGTVECTDHVVKDNRKVGLQDLLKTEKFEERFKGLASGVTRGGGGGGGDDVEMEEGEIIEEGEIREENETGRGDIMEQEGNGKSEAGAAEVVEGDEMEIESDKEDWSDEGEEELEDDAYPDRKRFTSMLEVLVRKRDITRLIKS